MRTHDGANEPRRMTSDGEMNVAITQAEHLKELSKGYRFGWHDSWYEGPYFGGRSEGIYGFTIPAGGH